MTRQEYMNKLENLLQGIEVDERNRALRFYEDFFEEAGIGNEKKAIKELGPPSRVAQLVKEEFRKNGVAVDNPPDEVTTLTEASEEVNHSKLVIIFLLCIFAIPIGIPVATLLLGSTLGIVIVLMGLFLTTLLSGAMMVGSGIICIFSGIVEISTSLPLALLIAGTGLILVGFGFLVVIFSSWIFKKVLPTFVGWVFMLIKRPFNGMEVNYEETC